jgi:hypothetical protein
MQVADDFEPVSPLSPSPSPGPAEERPMQLNRSISLPVENTPGNRNSITKHGLGMAVSEGESSRRDSDPLDDHFDPNSSRFVNRPGSSASASVDSSVPYRSRISRISFSYPRRATTPLAPSIQPAHPYALYQQTTFEEPEDIEEHPPRQSIPIGFTGIPARFQRRTGPEGEELDVIGPDGHTEQLPPYSRYPEAGPMPQKTAMVNISPVSSTGVNGVEGSSSLTPLTPISPSTADISPVLSTVTSTPHVNTSAFESIHQPESQNRAALPSPNGAVSHSTTSSEARAVQSSASSLAEEKRRRSGSWSSIKRKKMLCGVVPLWLVILIGLLTLFLAIIAGGVIGGLLTGQRERRHR